MSKIKKFAYYQKKAGVIIRRDGVLALLRKALLEFMFRLCVNNPVTAITRNFDFNFQAHQRRIQLSETLYSLTDGIVRRAIDWL